MIEILNPWQEYSRLLSDVESIFKRMSAEYSSLINCKRGCDDCCKAPFRLSLIEAASIRFSIDHFDRIKKREIIDRAKKSREKSLDVFSNLPKNPDEAAITVAKKRLVCPLLSDGICSMYPVRPVTCRLYGLPSESYGKTHVCPKSGFKKGQSYPTVSMDRIMERLESISIALVKNNGLNIDSTSFFTMAQAITIELPDKLAPQF